MNRRDFFHSSFAATTAAGLGTLTGSANAAETKVLPARELYEIRIYRLKPDSDANLVHRFLEKAAIPALNRLGCEPIGAFTEIDSKEDPAVYLLVPYPSYDLFVHGPVKINADPEYQTAGAEYLESPQNHPAFVRIDSTLLLAFTGMPQIERPDYSKEKKPRIFELRTYQSHSEVKALKKVEMFNSGEIPVMREVGLGPIFFGEGLCGNGLPHLTYMLSAEDRESHNKHWGGFGKHPVWKKLSGDPQYKDTVSKIINKFLSPTTYSQL